MALPRPWAFAGSEEEQQGGAGAFGVQGGSSEGGRHDSASLRVAVVGLGGRRGVLGVGLR